MGSNYRIASTSSRSADVTEDILLTDAEEAEHVLTRRILRVQVVKNDANPKACVKACLMHQKRHDKGQPWQDADAHSLATLKAGEEVRLSLDSAQTLNLYRALEELYLVGADGIPSGERRLRVVDENDSYVATGWEREIIAKLLEQGGDQLLQIVDDLHPHLLQAAMDAKQQRLKRDAVRTFEEQIGRDDEREAVGELLQGEQVDSGARA